MVSGRPIGIIHNIHVYAHQQLSILIICIVLPFIITLIFTVVFLAVISVTNLLHQVLLQIYAILQWNLSNNLQVQ